MNRSSNHESSYYAVLYNLLLPSLIWDHIFSQILLLNTPQPVSYLNVRNQVLCPHKTMGRVTI